MHSEQSLFRTSVSSRRGSCQLTLTRSCASWLVPAEVLGERRTAEVPAKSPRKMDHGSTWSIARQDVLGLTSVVSLYENDAANGIAANASDVVFQPAVGIAVRTGEIPLLAAFI